MLGLDPALAQRAAVRRAAAGAGRGRRRSMPIYVPSAPWGGDCRSGPIAASRTTTASAPTCGRSRTRAARGVRFAAECLAFANVPDARRRSTELAAAGPAVSSVHDPRWKAGVPRDVGSGWDFDDVRDHYLGDALRGRSRPSSGAADPERYLELSRAVSGEVMAEVFGEWRRAGSACGGGLVLWLRDLRPGRRLGGARPSRRAEGRLPPPAPGARAARRLEHRRGPRRDRRARRQRRPERARGAPARGAVQRLRGAASTRPRASSSCPPHGDLRARRRGAARPLRRRLVGVPLRSAGAGSRRPQPRARGGRRRRAALAVVPASRPGGRLLREPASRLGLDRDARAAGDERFVLTRRRHGASPTACGCTSRVSSRPTTRSRSSRAAERRDCADARRR